MVVDVWSRYGECRVPLVRGRRCRGVNARGRSGVVVMEELERPVARSTLRPAYGGDDVCDVPGFAWSVKCQ